MKGSMLLQNVLAIDVAKGKSMVLLISSCGEVLIEPYEINHSINYFTNLLNRINKLKLGSISVIMESTGIYHRPVERFFLENNFKVFVINPIYGKMHKRNLRKTKTDKEFASKFERLDFNEKLDVFSEIIIRYDNETYFNEKTLVLSLDSKLSGYDIAKQIQNFKN